MFAGPCVQFTRHLLHARIDWSPLPPPGGAGDGCSRVNAISYRCRIGNGGIRSRALRNIVFALAPVPFVFIKRFFSFPFRRLDYPLLTLPSTFKRALLAIETPGKFPAALRKNRIKTPASKGYSSKWVCKIGKRGTSAAYLLDFFIRFVRVSACKPRKETCVCAQQRKSKKCIGVLGVPQG